MPTYIYQHPKTNEIVEVSQKISEAHEYTDSQGVQWNRVFTVPYASIPNMTRIEAGSEQDFMKRTEGFDGTMGDLMDLSKDLSNKRIEERGDGTDNVKQKFFKGIKLTVNNSIQSSKHSFITKKGILVRSRQ